MSQLLRLNYTKGDEYVEITPDNMHQDRSEWEYEFEIRQPSDGFSLGSIYIMGRSGNFNGYVRIGTDGVTTRIRYGNVHVEWAWSLTQRDIFIHFRFVRRSNNDHEMFVNGVSQGIVSSTASNSSFPVNRIAQSSGNFSTYDLKYLIFRASEGGVVLNNWQPNVTNGVGSILVDTTGNNNGTLVNSPSWLYYFDWLNESNDGSILDYGLKFDGTQAVETNVHYPITWATDDWFIEWKGRNYDEVLGTICAQNLSATGNQREMQLYTNANGGDWALIMWVSGQQHFLNATSISDDKVYRIEYRGSLSEIRLFEDGVQINILSSINLGSPREDTATFTIGARHSNSLTNYAFESALQLDFLAVGLLDNSFIRFFDLNQIPGTSVAVETTEGEDGIFVGSPVYTEIIPVTELTVASSGADYADVKLALEAESANTGHRKVIVLEDQSILGTTISCSIVAGCYLELTSDITFDGNFTTSRMITCDTGEFLKILSGTVGHGEFHARDITINASARRVFRPLNNSDKAMFLERFGIDANVDNECIWSDGSTASLTIKNSVFRGDNLVLNIEATSNTNIYDSIVLANSGAIGAGVTEARNVVYTGTNDAQVQSNNHLVTDTNAAFNNHSGDDFRILQSYADTNLVGQGYTGSNINEWVYYTPAVSGDNNVTVLFNGLQPVFSVGMTSVEPPPENNVTIAFNGLQPSFDVQVSFTEPSGNNVNVEFNGLQPTFDIDITQTAPPTSVADILFNGLQPTFDIQMESAEPVSGVVVAFNGIQPSFDIQVVNTEPPGNVVDVDFNGLQPSFDVQISSLTPENVVDVSFNGLQPSFDIQLESAVPVNNVSVDFAGLQPSFSIVVINGEILNVVVDETNIVTGTESRNILVGVESRNINT